jgi:hypothetical protein
VRAMIQWWLAVAGMDIPMAGQAGSWRVRPIRLLIVLVVTGAGLAGCTGGGDRDPGQAPISVSPLAALVDQPVVVTVRDPARGGADHPHRQGQGQRRDHLVGQRPVHGDRGRGGVAGPAVCGWQLRRGQPHGAVHAPGSATGLGGRLVRLR